MLQIYNSLTRKKEKFVPLEPGKIGIYVCGNTVYDHCHLGHARSMVCFDVFVRFLRYQGFAVNYVRNITDIDDKIINRANERGLTIQALTKHYIEAQHQDSKTLNIQPPNKEPKATEHITPIIELITVLLEKEHAYLGKNGDVFYRVESFPDYGKLSHKDIDGLLAGARIDVVDAKASPLDFVLWKAAKPEEPSWPSPWGQGRPGWHIECSAMAMQELGQQFDIHGGGADLQFPHHENEIAQSEAASNKPFANYWMHVGMLQVNNEKMAKSLGNFFTIHDMVKKYQPEVIRYFLLSSHYRSALNYTEDNMLNAHKALTRLYQSLKEIPSSDEAFDETWVRTFNEAMEDDFNTPIALSVLFNLSHAVNKNKDPKLAATLKHLGKVLGILEEAPETFLQAGDLGMEKEAIEALIQERLAARALRDWNKADEIRQRLAEQGIELEDKAEITTWRKV